MKKIVHYIGLDVHKESIAAAIALLNMLLRETRYARGSRQWCERERRLPRAGAPAPATMKRRIKHFMMGHGATRKRMRRVDADVWSPMEKEEPMTAARTVQRAVLRASKATVATRTEFRRQRRRKIGNQH